jgi:hypothetical protein
MPLAPPTRDAPHPLQISFAAWSNLRFRSRFPLFRATFPTSFAAFVKSGALFFVVSRSRGYRSASADVSRRDCSACRVSMENAMKTPSNSG